VLFMALGGGWEPDDTNLAQGAANDANEPASTSTRQ
jgi:hypothetical protein